MHLLRHEASLPLLKDGYPKQRIQVSKVSLFPKLQYNVIIEVRIPLFSQLQALLLLEDVNLGVCVCVCVYVCVGGGGGCWH